MLTYAPAAFAPAPPVATGRSPAGVPLGDKPAAADTPPPSDGSCCCCSAALDAGLLLLGPSADADCGVVLSDCMV